MAGEAADTSSRRRRKAQTGPMSLAAPVVFFTGAGVSAGAGLPTYRGTGGIYTNSDDEPPNVTDLIPERLPWLWQRFGPRMSATDRLQPAAAHRAIADLEQRLGTVTVVTQNVDGLHQAAGSSRIWELHGSLRTLRCFAHDHRHRAADATWAGGVPRCPQCAGPCRPDVVLFGEGLEADTWQGAVDAIGQARTFVAVGTSGVVTPAAYLLDPGLVPDAARFWVNPEDPPPFPGYTWLRGDADRELGSLLR